MSGTKKLIISSRESKKVFDLYESSDINELYVDGIAQVMMGSANSKVGLFSVSGTENNPDEEIPVEIREIKLRITMPTSSLVEFCLQTLSALRENAKEIESELESEKMKISKISKLFVVDE
jgi:hypothetical protein